MLPQLVCPSQHNVTQKSYFRELLTKKACLVLIRRHSRLFVSVMKLPAKWIGHALTLIAILDG